jgi:hypothetical protein
VQSTIEPMKSTAGAIALGMLFVSSSFQSSPQVALDNKAALNPEQLEVLPLLEPIINAVLRGDREALIQMFDSSGGTLMIPQQVGIATFQTRFRDRSDIYSCMIFDTACARPYFEDLGNSLESDNPQLGNAALLISKVYVSVLEFLKKHKTEMQVTFQPQPRGTVQAELHIPRRADADQVPPPLGMFESLTIGFVKRDSGWKINTLFPESYFILTQFF